MQITNCLHPQRVYNKYLQEYIYAPCGACSVCLKNKSSQWTQRLIAERYCWRYCVFFTLTYDKFNVPILKSSSDGNMYYDLSHKHYHPLFGDVVIDVRDEVLTHDFHVNEPGLYDHNKDWLDKNTEIYYLSRGDLQRFIKRLRTTTSRALQKAIKDFNKENVKHNLKSPDDSKFRYYAIGEYGSTSLRPHYHGVLFFSSEWLASHIKEFISSCWQFGLTDSSFVSGENASYVAGYVNSLDSLPQILLHKRIRPFALFSKHPFIGSLSISSSKVKEVFFSASPRFAVFDHKRSAFSYVPLWLSYSRSLYPKISGFSDFSHTDRVNIYRAYERYSRLTDDPNFDQFKDYICGRLGYCPTLYKDYAKKLLGYDVFGHVPIDSIVNYTKSELYPLLSWYYISSRVYHQSLSFEIPIRMYVSIIERFYNNVEKEKLKEQLDYQEKLSEDGRLVSALSLDREFVRTILDLEKHQLSISECLILQSYNIDIDKFYSEDLRERDRYRYSILPDTCFEYQSLSIDSAVWLHEHTKNKFKNDYLINHPELNDYVWKK